MFEQIKLPYAFGDLEPHIDAATMEVHYTGHHATYTKNLNDLAEQIPTLKEKTAEEILTSLDSVPEQFRTAVRNNGGGFLLHNLYFEALSPSGGQEVAGALKEQIDKDFGDFETLKAELKKAALGQFGSGYAWLVYSVAEKKLLVKQTANQDLVPPGMAALLIIDVWEHAYYLKYRNKRAAHLDAIFEVINWDMVAARFEAAPKTVPDSKMGSLMKMFRTSDAFGC